MKIITHKNRIKYFDLQIKRSMSKFLYCKVNFFEVLGFYSILNSINDQSGPILCLGTRNGREVDLFRNIFFIKNPILNFLIKITQINKRGYTSILPVIESIGRSNTSSINENSVIGVEINPEASRKDIRIGSFDEMPLEWSNKFSILYSNSFDQSQDPYKTAKEWKRVAKKNSILIFGYSYTPPSPEDPIGNIEFEDVMNLFGRTNIL